MRDVNTLLGFQSKTPQRSIVRVQGSVSGSNDGRSRTWTRVVENTGSDLVYNKDTANGDVITIVSAGLYIVYYTDSSAAANDQFGVVRNKDGGGTVLSDMTSANDYRDLIALAQASTANVPAGSCAPIFLNSGDRIRCVTAGLGAVGANVNGQLWVVAKVLSL